MNIFEIRRVHVRGFVLAAVQAETEADALAELAKIATPPLVLFESVRLVGVATDPIAVPRILAAENRFYV